MVVRDRRVQGPAALPIVGLVFVVVAVIGLLTATISGLLTLNDGKTAHADGVVVGFKNLSGRVPNPVIAFTVSNGEPMTFTNAVASSNWKVGDHQPLVYDPAKPSEAVIDGIGGRWFFSFLLGLLGGASLLIGIFLTVLGRVLLRRKANAKQGLAALLSKKLMEDQQLRIG